MNAAVENLDPRIGQRLLELAGQLFERGLMRGHDDGSDLGQGPRRRDDGVRRMIGEPALVRWATL